jgi:nitrogen fixation protein NifB
MLVNLHLGEADRFLIYSQTEGGFALEETRVAPQPGGGQERWKALTRTLKGCRAVLVSGIGDSPRSILERAGIRAVEMYGFIEQGLEAVFNNGDVRGLKGRRVICTKDSGCGGGGTGCG